MHDLLNFVMYYALFKKKLFDNKNAIIKYFPKNVFGIFSTIRRFNKLKTYPKDIHGCIGYWDTNFNTLNKQTLYNELLNVSHDSVWSDERRHYFPTLETDPNTVLELDFMMNPIYKINKTNGIIIKLNTPFTNKIYNINNNAYCKKLLSELPFSKKDFERQEIIIGLNDANCNIPFTNLTYNLDDSIFKMNWVIQAIISYNKVPSSNLINILERKILNMIQNIKLVETNELAVSFEALSFVYRAKQILSPLLFQLFFELEQRKNCVNALYSFLDNSARVDITCHILNGLIQLQ
jgi:hypothetical protein